MKDILEDSNSLISQVTTGTSSLNVRFIVIDNLNCDLFVHFDDLSKAGIVK